MPGAEGRPARAPAADAPAAELREARDIPWGDFSIAPLFRKTPAGKVQIGWGANCGCHTNAGDVVGSTPCQKQVHYGKAGPGQLSDAECRRMAKCWLILGRGIAGDDVEGRTRHVHRVKVRRDAPVAWTEEVLEGMKST